MPNPMYFHPFTDRFHYIGWGPKNITSFPSWVSLHGVSPRIGGAHYKYLHKMGANSTTFQRYTHQAHRIYVMGHCAAGSQSLTTETFNYDSCYYYELAQMFVNHGLPPDSDVHIRIHACNSGSPSAPGQADSFAEQFKAEMAQRNFNTITVRGYTAQVGAYLGTRWAGFEPANNYAVDF